MSRQPPEGSPHRNGYQPRSSLTPPSRTPWIVLAVALLVAAAAAVLWYLQRPAAGPAAAPAPAPSAEGAPAAAPTGPAPAVDAARVRSLLEPVSPDARFRRWLEGDLVRRWVVVTDNLAEGVSPRGQLGFLAPGRPFSVVRRGKQVVIAPDSYRRYDEFADVVASVDAQALAGVYRELHAVLEPAYRALGYPEASLDRVTAKALQRIERAPVRDGEVAVEGEGGLYLYVDARLENLGSVEKHLLRMGPRNTRLLQAKAREILLALGLRSAGEVGPAAAPR